MPLGEGTLKAEGGQNGDVREAGTGIECDLGTSKRGGFPRGRRGLESEKAEADRHV